MPLFSKKDKKCIGIDIGTSSIKVIELTKKEETEEVNLTNYGMTTIKNITGRESISHNEISLNSAIEAISKTLSAVLKEAGIKTKDSLFSLPDFSSFLASFEIPQMDKEDIESAIHFQAKQRVPLPINQVTLDWNIRETSRDDKKLFEVVLLAVPNQTIEAYRKVAKKTGLDVGLLDAEAFGLAKVFGSKKSDGVVAVVDIGDENTNINVVEGETPKYSHNLSISTRDFTGGEVLFPEFSYRNVENDPLKRRTEKFEELSEKIIGVCEDYEIEREKEIDRLVVTGGGAFFDSLKSLLSENYEIGPSYPFDEINYPRELEDSLEELSPLLSVATGMALKGLTFKK